MDEMKLIEEFAERQRQNREQREQGESGEGIAELEKRANGGDEDAAWELYKIYADKGGKQPNDKKAAEWAKRARAIVEKKAEGGDGLAMWRLVNKGGFRKRNLKAVFGEDWQSAYNEWLMKTETLLKKQLEINPADYSIRSALSYYYRTEYEGFKGRETEQAIEVWRDLAESGDAEALFEIGCIYWNYTDDNGTCKQWFEKAARRGHRAAQYQMGLFYTEYKGVFGKDAKKAIPWFEKAASGGDGGAQGYLGYLYYNGCKESGLRRNYKKAVYWYKQLAANEEYLWDYDALVQIGLCYRNAAGAIKDEKKSFEMLKALAEIEREYNRQSTIRGFLAYSYVKGIGTEKDEKQAVLLWTQAAENGNEYAQNDLGYCYEKGYGVQKDLAKAAEYYKQAVENGYEKATKDFERLKKRGFAAE